MKTNTYTIGHYGRKGNVVATMEIKASNKKDAMAKYLKIYCKQTRKNCVFVEPTAQPKAEVKAETKGLTEYGAKAKAQPKAESKAATIEPKAKPKAKASGAKAETVALKATVVKPSKAKAQPKAEETERVARPELFTDELKAVKKLKGANARIDGTWMFVAGVSRDDKAYHEKLKAMGFKFSGRKQEWYKIGA